MKLKIISIIYLAILFFMALGLLRLRAILPSERNYYQAPQIISEDFYTNKVQSIFNNRCIACHSCLESPCQLNLQSYEGVLRGGIKNYPVYDGTRLKSVSPTRMFEDAPTTEEWRKRGFHDIIGNSEFSILKSSLDLGLIRNSKPALPVSESQFCSQSKNEFLIAAATDYHLRLAMPYGFPGLDKNEIQTIKDWIATGAIGPKQQRHWIPEFYKDQIEAWENFLNTDDLKHRITARYLYEHLFLAHLYFSPLENLKEPQFFKLIRSKNKCDQEVSKIVTRTPNADPGVKKWYYCFEIDKSSPAFKNHIPYELSSEKLSWVNKIFIDSNWTPLSFPSFDPRYASNPFLTFKDIPVKSRYEFLLNDSQYHIMTFIKGPVCNGTMAVNSIQEQFYVFFMNPNSDLMSMDPVYSSQLNSELDLPGFLGADVEPSKLFKSYEELLQKRNKYRLAKGKYLEKYKPMGLDLSDLWDGNKKNPNAVLTVLRHDDNAKVVKGAFGDLSKTAFVLDYSLFERLVYNLVVNFDVYGNVGHQTLTRLYMDLIRMEAENNFLDFLPPSQRIKLKNDWYRGAFTKAQLQFLKEMDFPNIPEKIKYTSAISSQQELVQKILFNHLDHDVRGPDDFINWKKIKNTSQQFLSEEEKLLSTLATTTGLFNRYFPELSYLIITEEQKPQLGYSIVRNREHENISWVLGEAFRSSPEEDRLLIGRGYYGSYPHLFWVVEKNKIQNFVFEAKKIRNQIEYNEFYRKYSLDRMNSQFWKIYDFINWDLKNIDPIEFGYVDLSRYRLD